jgi:hypothetical protein
VRRFFMQGESGSRPHDKLVTSSRIDFIGDLVLIVGIVDGLLMLYLGRRPRRRSRGAAASTPSAEPAA